MEDDVRLVSYLIKNQISQLLKERWGVRQFVIDQEKKQQEKGDALALKQLNEQQFRALNNNNGQLNIDNLKKKQNHQGSMTHELQQALQQLLYNQKLTQDLLTQASIISQLNHDYELNVTQSSSRLSSNCSHNDVTRIATNIVSCLE